MKNEQAVSKDQAVVSAEPLEYMTYEQAKHRIPERTLPDFWVGDLVVFEKRLAVVKKDTAETIATSPGGRPIYLVTYGERENVGHRANFNSAIGGRKPSAYMDKAARKKPVLLFVGPVHGQEVEGLTGLMNLIHIMERGQDLRGGDQSELRALGERCRLVIIPVGNPDGVARFEPRTLQGMGQDDIRFWGQGAWSDDRLCGWPECKRQHPMVGDNVGFLGCYFNDAGINPQHDEFFAPMGPEAPAILDVAREEGPDLAILFHSYELPPGLLRPAYVTQEIQQQVRTLAEQYYALLEERDLPHHELFSVSAGAESPPARFNLTSAVYHISGAISATFECPHGVEDGRCQVSLEEILDMQLTLYEAMMRYALAVRKRQEV